MIPERIFWFFERNSIQFNAIRMWYYKLGLIFDYNRYQRKDYCVSLTHHSKSKLAEEVSFINFILTCLNFCIQLFWKLNFITFFTQTSYATLSPETLEITWKNCPTNIIHFSDSSVKFWDLTSEKTNFYKIKTELNVWDNLVTH